MCAQISMNVLLKLCNRINKNHNQKLISITTIFTLRYIVLKLDTLFIPFKVETSQPQPPKDLEKSIALSRYINGKQKITDSNFLPIIMLSSFIFIIQYKNKNNLYSYNYHSRSWWYYSLPFEKLGMLKKPKSIVQSSNGNSINILLRKNYG